MTAECIRSTRPMSWWSLFWMPNRIVTFNKTNKKKFSAASYDIILSRKMNALYFEKRWGHMVSEKFRFQVFRRMQLLREWNSLRRFWNSLRRFWGALRDVNIEYWRSAARWKTLCINFAVLQCFHYQHIPLKGLVSPFETSNACWNAFCDVCIDSCTFIIETNFLRYYMTSYLSNEAFLFCVENDIIWCHRKFFGSKILQDMSLKRLQCSGSSDKSV